MYVTYKKLGEHADPAKRTVFHNAYDKRCCLVSAFMHLSAPPFYQSPVKCKLLW